MYKQIINYNKLTQNAAIYYSQRALEIAEPLSLDVYAHAHLYITIVCVVFVNLNSLHSPTQPLCPPITPHVVVGNATWNRPVNVIRLVSGSVSQSTHDTAHVHTRITVYTNDVESSYVVGLLNNSYVRSGSWLLQLYYYLIYYHTLAFHWEKVVVNRWFHS